MAISLWRMCIVGEFIVPNKPGKIVVVVVVMVVVVVVVGSSR